MDQPKTGQACTCKRGIQRDNCPQCEGTGWVIDFRAIRAAPSMELYDELLVAGCEMDSHASDLYVLDCPKAREILAKHKDRTTMMTSFIHEGKAWKNIPFAYLPWWRNRANKS